MTKAEKNNWREAETKAVYAFGLVGLEIKEILYGIEDYIIYVYTGDNSVHQSKLYYGDRPYFRFYGHRVYADECMRV